VQIRQICLIRDGLCVTGKAILPTHRPRMKQILRICSDFLPN
jgi:hypothetical protein